MTEENKYFVSDDFFSTPIHTLILNLCGVQKVMDLFQIELILENVFSKAEIKKSIEILLTQKLIEKLANGSFKRCFEGTLTTPSGRKSKSSQEYFRLSYRMADHAWEQPLDSREIGAFSFRLNLENVAKMKDLVRSFRREVTALYSEEQKPNAVYHCSLAVFPIFIPKKD